MNDPSSPPGDTDPQLDLAAATRATEILARFQRWLAWGIALTALMYLGWSIWVGLPQAMEALSNFELLYYLPVLALTLVNYGLRFWKWHYLLGRLGVRIPVRENLAIFASGLAMVLSPAKAGEVLKPYLVRTRTGVAMAHTIPALVTERLTDGIAVLILAAVGVSTYAGDHVGAVFVPIGLSAAGLLVLSHMPTSMAILGLLRRVPKLRAIGGKLEEMYLAMRICVAPVSLLLTLLASLVAWGAECIGYLLVLKGFGVSASLGVCTFLYAFATTAGGASPGGLGVADGVLSLLPPELIPGLSSANAFGASLLIRLATLWFGVLIGAIALLRVGTMVDGSKGTDTGARR